METDIKIIQTQLQRQIKQLQSDKIIVGRAAVFEKQLDELIEEQVKLKETEMNLMKKVKIAQKKSESTGHESQKRTQPVVSHTSLAKPRANSKTASGENLIGASGLTLHQEGRLKIMKEQLFNQNRQIQTLRHQIEEMKNCKVNQNSSTYLYDTKRKLEIKLIEAR